MSEAVHAACAGRSCAYVRIRFPTRSGSGFESVSAVLDFRFLVVGDFLLFFRFLVPPLVLAVPRRACALGVLAGVLAVSRRTCLLGVLAGRTCLLFFLTGCDLTLGVLAGARRDLRLSVLTLGVLAGCDLTLGVLVAPRRACVLGALVVLVSASAPPVLSPSPGAFNFSFFANSTRRWRGSYNFFFRVTVVAILVVVVVRVLLLLLLGMLLLLRTERAHLPL